MASSPLYRTPRLDTTRLASVLFESLFLHLVVEIIQNFRALIIPRKFDWNPALRGEGFTPAELSYAVGHTPLNIAYSALYAITMLLADGFLIHRMYLICRRNRAVTVPALILLAALIAACTMVIRNFGKSRDIFGNAHGRVLIVFALTFLCNFYSAIIIASMIRSSRNHGETEALARSSIDKFSDLLIQSAVLYCLLVVASLVLIAINSNAVYFTIGITSPIIGIIFSSIVTRTHDHVKLHIEGPSTGSSNQAGRLSSTTHPSLNPSIQNHFEPPSPV